MLLSILAASALAQIAPAQAKDKINAILSDDARTMSYTPCAEEDAAECISYEIDCRGDTGFGDTLSMLIFGAGDDPDARALAKTLIDKPFGEASVSFDVSGSAIDLTVAAVTVSRDELNGDWDLALVFDNGDALLDSLTESAAKNVKADVAGYPLVLSADAGTAKKLVGLRKACTRGDQ